MKNYLTFNALDTLCLKQAGLSQVDVPESMRRIYINAKLTQVSGLLDGLNYPYYNRTAVLTIEEDITFLTDVSNVFGDNNLLATMQLLDDELVITTEGVPFELDALLLVVVSDTVDNLDYKYKGIWRVSSPGRDGCNAVLISESNDFPSASLIDFSASDYKATVTIIKSFSPTTADISDLYVKDIIQIYDNGGVGNELRMFHRINDVNIFRKLNGNPSYNDVIAYYVSGDSVEFFIGEDATSLGTVTMEYLSVPTLMTESNGSTTIMLPVSYNQMLIDEILESFLYHADKALPPGLSSRLDRYKAMYDAKQGIDGVVKEKEERRG